MKGGCVQSLSQDGGTELGTERQTLPNANKIADQETNGSRLTLALLAQERAGKKCRVPFARNSPFGCFAQKVPDTYFPLIA